MGRIFVRSLNLFFIFNFAACSSTTSRDIASTKPAPLANSTDDEKFLEEDSISKATGEEKDMAGDAGATVKQDRGTEAPPAPVSTPPATLSAVTPMLAALTVSFDQVAQELGVPKSRLSDQVQVLSQF